MRTSTLHETNGYHRGLLIELDEQVHLVVRATPGVEKVHVEQEKLLAKSIHPTDMAPRLNGLIHSTILSGQ